MKLELLKPAKGSVRDNTRQGRGQGSGGGGTARRGHKGAKSRSGYSQKRGFEGGQMPLQRRVPKFGFKNINRIEYKAINLDTIQALAEKTGAKTMDLGFLYEHGLISKSDIVKILGRGEITSAVNVSVNAFSKSAIVAIEKVGGKASVTTKGNNTSENAETKITSKVVEVEKVSSTVAKSDVKSNNLQTIEGIGPKIADLLIADGITTFAKLSETAVSRLNEILAEAGSRYTQHNPDTWPTQAKLAAEGKMDELKELQDRLQGGRPE